MRYLKILLAGGTLFFSATLFADHLHSTSPKDGEQTRKWLEVQRTGAQASTHKQTLSGDVAASIYQRYMDSFKYPVPEYFTGKEADSATVGD